MKERNITRVTLEEARKMRSQTNWEKFDASDAEEPDEDDFEIDWSKAEFVPAPSKQAISLRVDPDVLEFFKSQGKGYQTRINAVLRSYMEAMRKG